MAGKSPEVSTYTLGASYSLPKLFFGVRASKSLTEFSGLLSYQYSKYITGVSSIKYSTKKSAADVTFGGLYYCAPSVGLKFKGNTDGILSFSAKKSAGKAFSVTGVAEVSVKDIKDTKFGVTATLG